MEVANDFANNFGWRVSLLEMNKRKRSGQYFCKFISIYNLQEIHQRY